MLQEAHALLRNGIDVKIGYIETHNREETHELLKGLPVIPRRKLFYKGKELEELDVQAVISLRPEIVIVDELALKEVAHLVKRKVETDVPKGAPGAGRHERFLACISSNDKTARNVIRKTSRLASYYTSRWIVLYVRTPREGNDRIALDKQRHLINNFKLATSLGAEVVVVEERDISNTIIREAERRGITTICLGKPHINLFRVILATNPFNKLLTKLQATEIDVVIFS